jgi:hypothetical protein
MIVFVAIINFFTYISHLLFWSEHATKKPRHSDSWSASNRLDYAAIGQTLASSRI